MWPVTAQQFPVMQLVVMGDFGPDTRIRHYLHYYLYEVNPLVRYLPIHSYGFISDVEEEEEEEEVAQGRIPIQPLPAWEGLYIHPHNSYVDAQPPPYAGPRGDVTFPVDVKPPPPYTGPYANLSVPNTKYDQLPSAAEESFDYSLLCVECPKCLQKFINLREHIPHCRGVTPQQSQVKYSSITEQSEVKYCAIMGQAVRVKEEPGMNNFVPYQGEEIIIEAIDEDSDDEFMGNSMNYDEFATEGVAVETNDADMEEKKTSSEDLAEEKQPFELLQDQFKIDNVFSLSQTIENSKSDHELPAVITITSSEEKVNKEKSVKIPDPKPKHYTYRRNVENELHAVITLNNKKVNHKKPADTSDPEKKHYTYRRDSENDLHAVIISEEKVNHEKPVETPDSEKKYYTYRRNTENDLHAVIIPGEDEEGVNQKNAIKAPDSKPKPYTCCHCSQVFPNMYFLTSHKLYVCGNKPFRCEVCSTKFTTRRNLICHQFTQKKCTLKKYECSKCRNRFVLEKGLNNHIVSSVCGADVNDLSNTVFRQTNYSSYHREPARSFEGRLDIARQILHCHFCFVACEDESQLDYHRTYFCSAKPHQCPNCHRRFLSRSKVLNHIFINCEVEEKMTQATEMIDASDATATSNFPTVFGGYSCQMCRQKCMTLTEFVLHLEMYCSKLPYQCRGCQKRFLTIISLQAHQNRHLILANINQQTGRESPNGFCRPPLYAGH